MLSTHSPFTSKTMFSARENRCRRFQANIFNKSKCQNCFKPVDSHKLSEADLFQVRISFLNFLIDMTFSFIYFCIFLCLRLSLFRWAGSSWPQRTLTSAVVASENG